MPWSCRPAVLPSSQPFHVLEVNGPARRSRDEEHPREKGITHSMASSFPLVSQQTFRRGKHGMGIFRDRVTSQPCTQSFRVTPSCLAP